MLINILFPKNNQKISLNRANCKKYLNDDSFNKLKQDSFDNFDSCVDVFKFCLKRKSNTKGKPLNIRFSLLDNDSIYKIVIKSKDNKFKKIYETKSCNFKVYNLIPGNYELRVECGNDKSQTIKFSIIDEYRFIYSPKAFNIRDIGGKRTYDNRIVKYGLLYRGIELTTKGYRSKINRIDYGSYHPAFVTDKDIPFLYELGFKTELDLRQNGEALYIKKSPISSKENYIKYVRLTIDGYKQCFQEKHFESLRKIFDLFANADKNPLYVHCWGGADRTGTICFLLEAVLGVQLKYLIQDYELTTFLGNVCRAKKYDSSIDPYYRENANISDLINFFISIRKDKETIQDTVIRYLVHTIGIKEEVINRIKEIFLI